MLSGLGRVANGTESRPSPTLLLATISRFDRRTESDGRPSGPFLPSFEMFSKRIHAVWFGIHFLLITAVCFAGIFSLIAVGSTMLPLALDPYAQKAEVVAAWLLGKQAGAPSPIRRGIGTYLHAAGIQAGYTFFAPNVPGYHRLTLELFYEDGRVEYESPHLRSKAAALRLNSLLNKLAEQRYEPVREVLVKRLAFSLWREHPEVKKVRATFGSVNPPGISEFEQGKTETFQPMFSFDFSVRDEQKQ
jgi:hypothetical protein